MARLVYSAIASLDGYVAEEQGDFDWSVSGDEVRAVAELEASATSDLSIGGGARAFPAGVRLDFELVRERRFADGVVRLHHRVADRR